jgi:hypothetical protein
MSAPTTGRYMTKAQRADSRRRANARQRALQRLSREYAERYRQLYSEELEAAQ